MENDTDKAREMLQHFDKIFETETFKHRIFDNMKLLQKIFEYFDCELYKPSPIYKEFRKQHIEISDLLEQSFTEAQKALFDKFMEIGNKMLIEENEQLFYFGYIIAKELERESKI